MSRCPQWRAAMTYTSPFRTSTVAARAVQPTPRCLAIRMCASVSPAERPDAEMRSLARLARATSHVDGRVPARYPPAAHDSPAQLIHLAYPRRSFAIEGRAHQARPRVGTDHGRDLHDEPFHHVGRGDDSIEQVARLPPGCRVYHRKVQ